LQIKSFLAGERSRQRVKKEVAASVFIKTIKYYENTNCTLKKGKTKSAQLSCVEVLHVNVGSFSAQLKCATNGISVQNVNVLPNIYGHIFEIFPYI
jgi:hypothetical protein